ncbi:TonB-dependent receptor plug domain-containing protein [Azonexus hydrophilus]|uniref:TonB-dependent receptor plug domain-containing protein n=1 Tax=Azonexus hydrophilus TaxID=418702 RepID=UPI002491DBCC|nr:TonB-dependent receptor [Azonexus hydrophilus]
MSSRIAPLILSVLVSGASASDELFFADLPVVASVSRLPQRLADAPASVTVIDREMIRASGVRSLNDIFRLVPGFQTFAHSDTAARVNYHGITDDNDFSPRVQVLIDGRSLHSPLFRNGMNWALVPVALEDIERIEVVRGSNSVSYGTNAFLGVVNIITIDPSLVQGSSLSASSGSQGVRDYTLRTGGRIGDNGSYRLTYQETKDEGLDDDYDWRDSYRNRRLDLRVNYAASISDSLELHLGRVDGEFTRGRLDTVTPPVVDTRNPFRALDESSLWIQTRWLRTLEDGADFSLRYTFSEDRGDDSYTHPSRPPGYNEVNESGDWGRRHEIEAMHNFSPIDKVRLVWGASWRHDAVSSKTMLHDRGTETRQVWRAFANSEWKPSSWVTANLGASSEYDTLAGNHLSPRASLAFHFNTENTVRVGYAQAWRTSSIFAYRANYLSGPAANQVIRIGNPQLPAERLDSWELAYLGDWRDWRMSLDVRHFRERVSDRLMIVRTGASPIPDSEQSIQDITMRGYEVQFKWQPLEMTRVLLNHYSIRIDSRFSENGQRILETPGSNIGASPDRYVRLADESAPRRSSSVLLMQKLPLGFDLSLARYWVGGMRWTRNTSVDKYARTDARLAHTFKLGGKRGEIAYTVQSLDGAHVEQRKAGSQPNQRTVDRRHWVSLSVDF